VKKATNWLGGLLLLFVFSPIIISVLVGLLASGLGCEDIGAGAISYVGCHGLDPAETSKLSNWANAGFGMFFTIPVACVAAVLLAAVKLLLFGPKI
jgi:hypothetical protein